ncbi:hypothetical protein cyc_07440 [Cyclospora cayetanensis]|uniref:Uncharacterized protein n=1 Tax=Cyclospora cayetanensis TaxID=88456 RepID=A0A1D3DAE8_9EIME|nr:hypothetical protein cyc_07440 [Cyclospora cayetanensis]
MRFDCTAHDFHVCASQRNPAYALGDLTEDTHAATPAYYEGYCGRESPKKAPPDILRNTHYIYGNLIELSTEKLEERAGIKELADLLTGSLVSRVIVQDSTIAFGHNLALVSKTDGYWHMHVNFKPLSKSRNDVAKAYGLASCYQKFHS